MSLNKDKEVQEYLEYLYGENLEDPLYRPKVLQSRLDFLIGCAVAEPKWYEMDILPKDDRMVICYLEDTENPEWSGLRLGSYIKNKWHCKGGRKIQETVIAWMNIPKYEY